MFDFMEHVKEKAKKKSHLEQLAAGFAGTLEIEEVSDSEESVPEELDTEALVSKRVDQVRDKDLLMH